MRNFNVELENRCRHPFTFRGTGSKRLYPFEQSLTLFLLDAKCKQPFVIYVRGACPLRCCIREQGELTRRLQYIPQMQGHDAICKPGEEEGDLQQRIVKPRVRKERREGKAGK